jgi:hypothetical protein
MYVQLAPTLKVIKRAWLYLQKEEGNEPNQKRRVGSLGRRGVGQVCFRMYVQLAPTLKVIKRA